MKLRGGTVRDYLKALRDAADVPGSTEYTLRDSLIAFLSAASAELEFGMVAVRSELRLKDVGQPDLQVVDGLGAPIGYAETKPLGSASAFAHILESEQITRYRRSLENLLVTDFLRFTLFRADLGRLDVTLLETEGRLRSGAHSVSAAQLSALETLLSALFSAHSPMATSAEQLAEGLARRTTLLRDAIRALLTTPGDDGEALRRLHEFYRRSLMSDMTDDDFADTYAQTLVYALFLARLEGGPKRDLDGALAAIPRDVPILKSAIEPLRVAGRLPAPLATWLTDALTLLAATPDSVIGGIGHPSAGMPDPILYFYEHFLAAYDKIERIAKGVYYTPRPLVDYLVRAVDDSLVRDFGKLSGLADTGVRLRAPIASTRCDTTPPPRRSGSTRTSASPVSLRTLGRGAAPSARWTIGSATAGAAFSASPRSSSTSGPSTPSASRCALNRCSMSAWPRSSPTRWSSSPQATARDPGMSMFGAAGFIGNRLFL